MTTEAKRQQIHDALFVQATEKMDELRHSKDCLQSSLTSMLSKYDELLASHERLREALIGIASITERQQLPITAQVYEVANEALKLMPKDQKGGDEAA